MKSRPLFALLPLIVLCSAASGAPKINLPSNAPLVFSEDNFEARASYRATLDLSKNGNATWRLGRDTQNGVRLDLDNRNRDKNTVSASLVRVQNGKTTSSQNFSLPVEKGELGLVRVGRLLRVLWNGQLKAQIEADMGVNKLGTRTSGSWKLTNEQMQPTEPVVLRDDFMRASGPDEPEGGGVWKTQGNWKTSGTLGPMADASLSPNPFVFRAQGAGTHIARAGTWFWNDYTVAASVRAVGDDSKTPLVAGLEAFGSAQGSVRGEVDFRTGTARIVQTLGEGLSPTGLHSVAGRALSTSAIQPERVLAQSAPFDASVGEWHRLQLVPSNGLVRLLFDGHEVTRGKCDLMQGDVALRAQTGAQSYVDFDDVRVGAPQSGEAQWGEGVLPDRLVKDRLMKNWASAASAWKRDARGIWWHTGDFWRDATLAVPLPSLKEGQGFRFYLGANASTKKAAVSARIEQRGGRLELRQDSSGASALGIQQNGQAQWVSPSSPPHVLGLQESYKSPLSIVLSKEGSAALKWDAISVPLVAQRIQGTKIGIEPLQNGVPLPRPGLQSLSLQAPTMERDGQSVIGVNITPVSPQIAQDLGLPDATGIIIDHVEDGSPAQKAGFESGDIVRGANGARVFNVDTMRAAVGAVQPPNLVTLEILRPRKDASGLDWANCLATTSGQLDYAFTGAPVDWKSARGTWEVAERWTCSPQWSFFAGQNDEFPLLWSRFALAGDWTLEAYLATPMDLTRGERSPSDLNVSVGDGQSISSGYSFGFGANNRSQNLIWRQSQIVLTKPFEMPSGAGDTHQDWFYVRLERRRTARGVRFLWSVNGQPVGQYEDANPLAGANRLAFWTKNGAISLARVRLWHSGLKDVPLAPRPGAASTTVLPNVLGEWSPRDPGPNVSARLAIVNLPPGTKTPVLQIENPRDGGDWTTYLTRQPFDPARKNGLLRFDYRVPANVKLNLYALVGSQWREITWTGGASTVDSNQPTLGAIENVVADDAWHAASFDLRAALERNGLAGNTIEALAFAAPARDYLRQGLGGNPLGAKFYLRALQTFPATLARPVNTTSSGALR